MENHKHYCWCRLNVIHTLTHSSFLWHLSLIDWRLLILLVLNFKSCFWHDWLLHYDLFLPGVAHDMHSDPLLLISDKTHVSKETMVVSVLWGVGTSGLSGLELLPPVGKSCMLLAYLTPPSFALCGPLASCTTSLLLAWNIAALGSLLSVNIPVLYTCDTPKDLTKFHWCPDNEKMLMFLINVVYVDDTASYFKLSELHIILIPDSSYRKN